MTEEQGAAFDARIQELATRILNESRDSQKKLLAAELKTLMDEQSERRKSTQPPPQGKERRSYS